MSYYWYNIINIRSIVSKYHTSIVESKTRGDKNWQILKCELLNCGNSIVHI